MNIRIEADLSAGRALLQGVERQVPYALALAMTRTAEAGVVAVQQEMVSVFDRPTPFTLRSMRVKPARKTDLEAEIFLRDLGGSRADSARTRFAAHVFGGRRPAKKFEARLRTRGMLRVTEDAVPGSGARLDAYGNMSRAQLVDILREFDALGAQGYGGAKAQDKRAKRAKGTRTKYGMRYFFRRDYPGRGIYSEIATPFGRAIKPVLMFVRRSQYERRLDYEGVIRRVVDRQLGAWFEDAARQALRTAR